MSVAKPVRCQKCGKPLGYVTVLAKGLLLLQQPLQNVKAVAVRLSVSRIEVAYCYKQRRITESFYALIGFLIYERQNAGR